jgi:hypothetical protein
MKTLPSTMLLIATGVAVLAAMTAGRWVAFSEVAAPPAITTDPLDSYLHRNQPSGVGRP